MSKRKLNRRQTWRIKKIHDERAERASKRLQHTDQQLLKGELGPEQEGLVITHFGTQVDIEPLSPETIGQQRRCHLRANLGTLVTGDRVVWREGDPTGVIVAKHERHSELARPDAHGQLRPIAANIDHIVIVIAPKPVPHPNLINRYLVASEAVNIQPIILLNKQDMLDHEDYSTLEQQLSIYPSIGYQVLRASTKTLDGLAQLKAQLKDRTSVFVGQSGVGKSSLINALLPGVNIKTGELSKAKAKGTHTTTSARLFHFPEGGDLIDSPGIREFGLWHMNREEIAEGFIEFRPFLRQCRFRDCQHLQEPGCALQAAVERGDIHPARIKSFEQLVDTPIP